MSTVLVIGDTHCPAMRDGYVPFLQRTADQWGADKVIHIGDLVDWNSISYHEKLPTLANAESEYKKAKQQVKRLVKAFPEADWMIGNHDCLTERKAITAGLPPSLMLNYNDMWDCPWTVHPRFDKYEFEGVLYSHGDSGPGGKFASLNQAMANFQSTVIGHFHAAGGVSYWANPAFRVFGMSVGCGIDVDKDQFNYGKRYPAKPILGCGIVVDGKSAYFEPWLLKSR